MIYELCMSNTKAGKVGSALNSSCGRSYEKTQALISDMQCSSVDLKCHVNIADIIFPHKPAKGILKFFEKYQ